MELTSASFFQKILGSKFIAVEQRDWGAGGPGEAYGTVDTAPFEFRVVPSCTDLSVHIEDGGAGKQLVEENRTRHTQRSLVDGQAFFGRALQVVHSEKLTGIARS